MSRTKDEKDGMTLEKTNSQKATDRMVMDELMKMGFSYGYIGTHYLHDSIVFAISAKLENFASVREFCGEMGLKVCGKYEIKFSHYVSSVASAIEGAFAVGNIDYLLEVFKESYNHEKMSVKRNQFIMAVRQIILDANKKEQ